MKDKICIVGLGYVGLPLTLCFSHKYEVIGFDVNNNRIKQLKENYDSTLEVDSDKLLATSAKFTFNIDDIKNCNIYIITVPTPIDDTNKPDLTSLKLASKTVGSVLSKGDIVVYESTVYPGVTEEVCVPILSETSGLDYNKDFYCGYSPERVNPGDKRHPIESIIKVTSGSTPQVAQHVDKLYQSVISAGTFLASSIKVAEAAKVIENTQRDVNIALVNELALIFKEMGLDTNQVIDAASTKWNFIPYRPGLVGGHCIGVDPYYLTYKAEKLGCRPNLILASRQINNSIAKHVSISAVKELIRFNKLVNGAHILIMGFSFKENCPDIRNTKVLDLIYELNQFGVKVDVYDPWVDSVEVAEKNFSFIDSPFQSKVFDVEYDAVIHAVAHDDFKSITKEDYKSIMKGCFVLLDVKGVIPFATWRL